MESKDAAPQGAKGEALPEVRPIVTFKRADLIEFKPTSWLIREWLVKNTLAGIVGPSGAGKSFLAVDWACRVATGAQWLGHRVERGGVFYLAGEGQQGLSKRIRAWEQHFGQTLKGCPLFLADSLPFLCEDLQTFGTIDAIEAFTDELLFDFGGVEPSLIVLDTVARAMSGADENSAKDMGALIRSMDFLRNRWGATVLAIHHTGHGPADRARGSSAFKAALDSEFLLKPNDQSIELAGIKEKDWAKPNGVILEKVRVPIQYQDTAGIIHHDSSLILQSDTGAVIEAEKRRQVYRLKAQGQSLREIAAETGVPRATVDRWLKGFGDAD